METLAVKYRPKKFSDVVEQGIVIDILKRQIETKTPKNVYLMVGGAGTGKTTTARILANEINGGKGNPIEVDAASNNGVDFIRKINEDAKTQSIGCEYKVYIIDECHMLSTSAWNSFLKTIEEPPKKSVFILCTTDPQKIPATILSRVFRFNYKRISQKGISQRLLSILDQEGKRGKSDKVERELCDYLARLSGGGMRDAITMLDKIVSYTSDLTIEKASEVLGYGNYETMFNLTQGLLEQNTLQTLEVINEVHEDGNDLKLFIKEYTFYLLDYIKYLLTNDAKVTSVPDYVLNDFKGVSKGKQKLLEAEDVWELKELLSSMVKLQAAIKWDNTPKQTIEVYMIMECDKMEGQ